MCTEDTSDFSESTASESTDDVTAPAASIAPRPGWSRRTFLKAAALGAAAAALMSRGDSALADDRSGDPCTAEDFEIGTGTIVNPCDCPGTGAFTAIVQFPLRSTQNATRRCITLHPFAGSGFGDLILRNTQAEAVAAAGNSFFTGKAEFSDGKFMYVKIANFPCNSITDVTFNATVAWSTKNEDSLLTCTTPPAKSPPGQCRHQPIVIKAFGASLDCNLTAAGVQRNCAVPCGTKATLRACVNAAAVTGGATPFTYTLKKGSAVVDTYGPTADTCHDFTNLTVTANATYTVEIFDSRLGCSRPDSVNLSVEQVNTTLSVSGAGNCDGVLTFTAGAEGRTGCSFEWEIDDVAVSGNSTSTLIYDPCELGRLDGANHTVACTAVCGDCRGDKETMTVNQCVSTTVS